MADNNSHTPAATSDGTYRGTNSGENDSGADTISGGGGSDTISSGSGDDTIYGDAAHAGQWAYYQFDYDFSSAHGQAFDIEKGEMVGSGYVDDFAPGTLHNSNTDSTSNPDDFGTIYVSTLNVDQGGSYFFGSRSDDGSTIEIYDSAGNPVLWDNYDSSGNRTSTNQSYMNNDYHQSAAIRFGEVDLASGESYTIVVRHWENQGTEILDIGVNGPDTGGETMLITDSGMIGTPPSSYNGMSAQGVEGNDTIDSGDGNDTVHGDGGHDTIAGGAGNDTIDGGSGHDTMSGGTGDDVIDGGAGHDRIDGGSGNDTLRGGDGDDTISGGSGHDTIDGGAGDDRIDAGTGSDSITTGEGSDFVEGGSFGGDDQTSDIITDFDTDLDIADLSGFFEHATDLQAATTVIDGNAVVRLPDGSSVTFQGVGDRALLTHENTLVPCFSANTRVMTPRGLRAVETLTRGDLVVTRDHGLRPLAWVGQRHLSGADLDAAPNFRPVLIRAHSFGPGLPARDIRVSPQHRILTMGAATLLASGHDEALAPACHLLCAKGVERVAAPTGITYVHLMFDDHEVVETEGLWTESLLPTAPALGAFAQDARRELVQLFPELGAAPERGGIPSARPILTKWEAALVA
ncbi:MAG: Hint domain-containing protein [Celeribacter sp.]|jgi:hypothetical protein